MLSLIGQNWTHFLWALIATIMMVIIGFLTPLLLSEIVDSILGSEPFTMPDFLMNPINDLGGRDFLRQNLWIPALALILMNIVNGVFTFIKGRSSAIASENIARKLRNDLYRHLQHLPFAYHVKAQAGELIQRCTSDVDTIRRFLAVQVMEVVNTVLMVVIAMSILLPRSVPITLYSLILVPPLFCFATWFFKMVHKSFEVADEADGVLNAVLQENLSGVRVVRAFGQQEREVEKFDRVNNDLRKKNLRLNELLAIYWGGGDAISMTQTLLTLVVCIIYACNGWITVGTLIVFTSTLGMLLFPIRQLGRTLSDAGKAMVSMKRVQAILHEEAEPDEPNAMKPDLHGDIVFDHVSFAYPDDNVPVLRDVSFTIPAGKTAAVLGGTGSGKSTMMYLLQRLYTPTSGKITIGGVDIQQIDRKYLRAHVGLILQEPFLYSKSIRENVGITAPEQEAERIEHAADIASASGFIAKADKGWETVVGESGVTLRESAAGLRLSGRATQPLQVRTLAYPGFPTDMQAPMMALALSLRGTSVFLETIFENRFMHAREMVRMGASIRIEDRIALVSGGHPLGGTSVTSTDLRGGAALMLCGLLAEGETTLHDPNGQIARGYEDLPGMLRALGAEVEEE